MFYAGEPQNSLMNCDKCSFNKYCTNNSSETQKTDCYYRKTGNASASDYYDFTWENSKSMKVTGSEVASQERKVCTVDSGKVDTRTLTTS